MENKTLVVFDFDGTITYFDTLFFFLCHAVPWPSLFWGLFCSLPVFVSYLFRLKSNDQVKEHILSLFFKGADINDLEKKARSFACKKLPKLVREKAKNKIIWHQEQGHICVLLSANLELFLKPWATQMKFDQTIATQLDTTCDGQLNGRLKGKNCYGPEKVIRLKKRIADLENYYVIAYGDSRGDYELLEYADEAHYKPF